MELSQTSGTEYRAIFNNPGHLYNSADFNSLTGEARQMPVVYLGFKTGKFKLGIIGSDADGIFRSPFSAPFGGFACKDEAVDLADIEAATDLLTGYCRNKGLSAIELILPRYSIPLILTAK